MRGSPRSCNVAYFRCNLEFLGTLWVEGSEGLDSLSQLRNSDPETVGNEDALQDDESTIGDRKHPSKGTRTPKVFVVKRILDGSQVPGVVTGYHVDEHDAQGPDIGVERGIRNQLALFVEALFKGVE